MHNIRGQLGFVVIPISLWWIAEGVPLLAALKTSIAILALIGLGTWLWSVSTRHLTSYLSDSVVIGLPIGLACTGILPIFVPSRHLPTAFTALLVAGALAFVSHATKVEPDKPVKDPLLYFLVFSFSCLELLDTMPLLQLIGLYITLLFVISRFLLGMKPTFHLVTAIAFFAIALFAAQKINSIGTQSVASLSRLFLRTDDNIFAESVSHSIANLGIGNFAAATGIPLKYHFLSLSISGVFSRVLNLEPFVMTLHVIPALSFAMIALQTFILTYRMSRNRAASTVAVCVLFLGNTLPNQFRFFSTNTTTNTLSYIFVLGTLLVLHSTLTRPSALSMVSLTLLSVSSILSKAPYGVLLALCLCTIALAAFRDRNLNRNILVMYLLIPVFFMGAALLALVQPPDWAQREFSIEFSKQGLGGDYRPALIVFPMVLLLVLLTRFGLLFFYKHHENDVTNRLLVLGILTSVLGGLLPFMVDNGSNELYFLNFALLVSAPLTGIGSYHAWGHVSRFVRLRELKRSTILTATFFTCLGLAIELIPIVNRTSSKQVLLPLIWGIVVCLSVVIISRSQGLRVDRKVVVAAIILGLTAGSFLSHIRSRVNSINVQASYAIADPELIEALTWLRSSSNPTVLIATNRSLPCPDHPCDVDESSMAISAFSQRSVYIEGPRFIVGNTNYPPWVQQRIRLSLNVVYRPSLESLVALENAGVSIYLLDLHHPSVSHTQLQELLRLRKPVFSNKGILIFNI
jgi:hypothetical protein